MKIQWRKIFNPSDMPDWWYHTSYLLAALISGTLTYYYVLKGLL